MRAVRAHRASRTAVPPPRGSRATGAPPSPRPRTGSPGPEAPAPGLPRSRPWRRTGHDRPARPPCTPRQDTRRERARPCPLPVPGPRLVPSLRVRRRCGRVGTGRGIRGRGHPVRLRRSPRSWRRRWLVVLLRRSRRSGRAGSDTATGCSGQRPAPRSGSRRRTRRQAGSPPPHRSCPRRGNSTRPRRSRRGWPATGQCWSRASPLRRGPGCARPRCHPARLPTRPGARRVRPAGGRRRPRRPGPGPTATARVRAGGWPRRLPTASPPDPARTDAARVRGRSWAAFQWKASRLSAATPGSASASTPGLEDLGQPGVDPGPFVGHQVVVGRLTQQRMPELQGLAGLAQHVGVQRLPQIALRLGLVDSRQLGERLGVQPGPVDRGQPEQRPRALLEGVDPGQQQIRQVTRRPPLGWRPGRRPGAPRRTAGCPPTAPAPHRPSTRRAARRCGRRRCPQCRRGPTLRRSIRRDPKIRPISAKVFRNGWRRWSSSPRNVSTSSSRPARGPRQRGREVLGRPVRPVQVLEHARAPGPAAAASRTTALRSSNTCNASRLRGATGSSRVSIRRADGRDPRSSTPLRSDRTASTTGANDMPASRSRQWPVATVNPSPAARRSRSATRVVFPIPASPPTSAICGVPCAASPSASSSSAMSRSRPSSREDVPLDTVMRSTALGVESTNTPRPSS